MSDVICGFSVNEVLFNTFDALHRYGVRRQSRYGQCVELMNQELVVQNPRLRTINLMGRKNDYVASLAEVFWVLAGSDVLSPYMTFFLKRAKDFSDDGMTWHDAYGPRLYKHGQIDNVIDAFAKEGLDTRRAVIVLWFPEQDTFAARLKKAITNPLAVPCNNVLYFYVRDNKFCCRVVQRSCDVVWGLSHVNILEWTILHELMYYLLFNALPKMFDGIALGEYRHSIVSMHAYSDTFKQVEDVCDKYREQNLANIDEEKVLFHQGKIGSLPLIKTSCIKYKPVGSVQEHIRDFFVCLFAHYVGKINGASYDVSEVIRIFGACGLLVPDAALYEYAVLIEKAIDERRKHS